MTTVLIAEDSARTRDTIAACVRDAGFTPMTACTGLEAFKLARQHRPEVILLDGLLPHLHGFELARLVRSIDTAYQPAIVMVTGIYTKMADRHQAQLKYGIHHFVSKPFTREQIIREVQDAARETAGRRAAAGADPATALKA